MTLPIMEITVHSDDVEIALEHLARSARNLEPAMRDIAGLLERETNDNFRAQGRPRWKPLSQTTILNRLMEKDEEGRSKGLSSVLGRDGNLRASAKRKLDGGLAIKESQLKFIKDRYPVLGLPLIRGIVTFLASMVEGVKALQGGGYEVNTTPVSYQDYWTAVTGRGGNLGIGEANIYDATNVRLRNLSLSYSFPKKLLERSKVLQSVKLGFSVNNVCMIYSAMDGIDPESVFATSTNATGFEYGGIPTSRSFVFNVSFGF